MGAMQRSRIDAFIPTTVFASGFVQYVSGIFLPAVWQGARYINSWYSPSPCFVENPRRLRLMPSSKWSFSTLDGKIGANAESIDQLVGSDNVKLWGADAWNLFELHCTTGGLACFAVNTFLVMSEKLAWSHFTPRELAPQIVP